MGLMGLPLTRSRSAPARADVSGAGSPVEGSCEPWHRGAGSTSPPGGRGGQGSLRREDQVIVVVVRARAARRGRALIAEVGADGLQAPGGQGVRGADRRRACCPSPCRSRSWSPCSWSCPAAARPPRSSPLVLYESAMAVRAIQAHLLAGVGHELHRARRLVAIGHGHAEDLGDGGHTRGVVIRARRGAAWGCSG